MMNGYELGYNGYQYGLYWVNNALILDTSWDLQWGSLRKSNMAGRKIIYTWEWPRLPCLITGG